MSIHSNNFYSNILRQPAQVQVILPEPLNAAGQVQSAYMSGDQRETSAYQPFGCCMDWVAMPRPGYGGRPLNC